MSISIHTRKVTLNLFDIVMFKVNNNEARMMSVYTWLLNLFWTLNVSLSTSSDFIFTSHFLVSLNILDFNFIFSVNKLHFITWKREMQGKGNVYSKILKLLSYSLFQVLGFSKIYLFWLSFLCYILKFLAVNRWTDGWMDLLSTKLWPISKPILVSLKHLPVLLN